MTFLVTGGLGLIGHNIVQRLQARDEQVVILDTKTTYFDFIPQDELDYLMSEVARDLFIYKIYEFFRYQ